MNRIADIGYMKHDQCIGFLTSLLIDLKFRELGREPREPITMARLDEASKHVGELMQCRKQVVFK